MTKLTEWLSVGSAVIAVWWSFVAGHVKAPFLDQYMPLIQVSPIICIALFGLYAVTVVLYRVFTFNDCEQAAKELQEEIIEAKNELKNMGLKL